MRRNSGSLLAVLDILSFAVGATIFQVFGSLLGLLIFFLILAEIAPPMHLQCFEEGGFYCVLALGEPGVVSVDGMIDGAGAPGTVAR